MQHKLEKYAIYASRNDSTENRGWVGDQTDLDLPADQFSVKMVHDNGSDLDDKKLNEIITFFTISSARNFRTKLINKATERYGDAKVAGATFEIKVIKVPHRI